LGSRPQHFAELLLDRAETAVLLSELLLDPAEAPILLIELLLDPAQALILLDQLPCDAAAQVAHVPHEHPHLLVHEIEPRRVLTERGIDPLEANVEQVGQVRDEGLEVGDALVESLH
jgi:hypothetical protein